jgi:ribosomal-protein-alanine N-acetyltransferase
VTPDALAALHVRCFTSPPPFSARDFAALLATPHVFLCPAPGGFALGRAVAGEAELLTLAVDPARRRQGLGALLLADFEAEAAYRKAQEAFLEVAADNVAARQLYASAGYSETGQRRGYYRPAERPAVDALILTKRLGHASV